MSSLLALLCATAVTQLPPAPPKPLGITVSGGVSLGSYEAGFLYLYLEAEKLTPKQELKIVTGASAGSVNALVSAISSCRPPNEDPLEDLGWRAWGGVGFRQLFNRERASREALFSRDALNDSFERVREVWKQGLPESCDVVVGVVVTRVTPRSIELQKGLTIPRLEEKFVLRIQGRGVGKAPKLSNYVVPSSHIPQPLLPLIDDENDASAQERNFTQLRSLIFASAAFPVAFAPQPIEYCLSKPPRDGEAVSAKNTECTSPEFLDLFIDGGVFDNNPLRLGYLVAENRLRRTDDGRTVWRDLLSEGPSAPVSDIRHIYLDPDTSAYPPEEENAEDHRENGLFEQVFKLGGGFVETARARELASLAEERKELTERMRLTASYFPKASEHLHAFVGFFDRDFRLFDFYLGMYDAFRELKGSGQWSDEQLKLVRPESEVARRHWAPFACMLGTFEPGYESYASWCEGDDLRNFRILMQVTLDRLSETCRPTQRTLTYAIAGYHHLCSRARQGYPAPVMPGLKRVEPEARHRRDKESAFGFSMRLLGDYGYTFTDLVLPPEEAHLGTLAIRRELDAVMDAWAQAQPTFAERVVAKTALRTALNGLEFTPPRLSSYVVVGTTLEAGGSAVPLGWQSRWFQVTGAAEVNYLFSLFTPGEHRTSLSLTLGPEFHLSFLSNAIFQPRVAVRGGVQLTPGDGLSTKKCSDTFSDPRYCTQGVLEGVVVVTLLERLRAEVVLQTFPAVFGRDSRAYTLQLGIGAQFY